MSDQSSETKTVVFTMVIPAGVGREFHPAHRAIVRLMEELAVKDRLIISLGERVAMQSELLTRKAIRSEQDPDR